MIILFFSSSTGGKDFKNATQFIIDKFVAQNENPSKPIYPHITCATDTENVQRVFDSLRDVITRSAMEQSQKQK